MSCCLVLVLVLCGASSLAIGLAQEYSQHLLNSIENPLLQPWTGFPSNSRAASAIIACIQLPTAMAALLAHVYPISSNARYLCLTPAGIIATAALGLCFTAESPRWLLLRKQQIQQAKASLRALQGHHGDVCHTLAMFLKEEEQFCERTSIAMLRTYLHSLLLAVSLLGLPSVCGIHVYDFYSAWVYKFADIYANDKIITLSVRIAAVSIASGILLIAPGPQSLGVSLIISTGTIAIALGATGLCLFSLEQGENWTWIVPWLPMVIHLVFQITFWLGVSSHAPVTAFQFTPSPLRPSILSLAGGLHWFLVLTASKFLVFMINTIHPFGVCWFYAATSALGLVLIVFRVVPNLSKETIICGKTPSLILAIQETREETMCELEGSVTSGLETR
ncbi:uncharacterized protein [Periplaneta americana]|uniref:uncharacterized protein isoform X2 n=1 Tax=Periplaneta americana TaxID=6978 RepID=UPI0037E73FEE